ncbi:nucleoside-diphosphate kinase [Candidatus Peregrinibacteria bacterium CG08_land_8_20_14_0_20_41_10]|nr:MAG: nucleoside-diphosphate kinase [Candidatus Peregrinibacteria bacterium CG08_land_8_20_14_0_20_41_10]
MLEQTLVVIKPDGAERNLVGEIIRRYEAANLKIMALKMLKADEALVNQHYPADEEYLISLGKKSEKSGNKIDNYRAQGLMILNGLHKFITRNPVVAMVIGGEGAIQKVRQITGYTDPTTAEKGTIRGDFPHDSILEANREKRAVENLIHTSGNPEEAAKEIKIWFKPEEIFNSYYRKPGQEVPKGLFSRGVDNKTDKGIFSS